MQIQLEKSNENLRTSVIAILQMTPKNRQKFYATEEGRDIVKGLFLEAENNKKSKFDGTNWTPQDLEDTINALRESSEDDWKIFLQLLPGPVQARITEHVNKARSNNGLSPTVIEKGAKIGTAGYVSWLQKRRMKQKISSTVENKPLSEVKTPKVPAVPKVGVKPNGPKSPKPIGYGKFIAKKPKKI